MRHEDVPVPESFLAGRPPASSAEPIASISHMVAREREFAFRHGFVRGYEAREDEQLEPLLRLAQQILDDPGTRLGADVQDALSRIAATAGPVTGRGE